VVYKDDKATVLQLTAADTEPESEDEK
jgi:hypothetical protein